MEKVRKNARRADAPMSVKAFFSLI